MSPTPLKWFNDQLLALLPRPEWFHCSGKNDLKAEPQYGSAIVKISHNSARAQIANTGYVLVYYNTDRIVVRNHGLKAKYLGQIIPAILASAAHGQKIEVL